MAASSLNSPILIIPSSQVSQSETQKLEEKCVVIKGSPVIWDLISNQLAMVESGKPICVLTDVNEKVPEFMEEENEAHDFVTKKDSEFFLAPYLRKERKDNLRDTEEEVKDKNAIDENDSHVIERGPRRGVDGYRFQYHRRNTDMFKLIMKYKAQNMNESSMRIREEEPEGGKGRGRGRGRGRSGRNKN